MIKKSLKAIGVSILTVLLAVSLTACEDGGGGDTGTGSGSAVGQGPVTEWETLTSEVMKLYSSGDYIQGIKVAERALQVAQQNDGPDHPNVALSLSNLAELYEAQREYAKAEPLYKHSLEILEKVYGKDNPFLVPTLLNMASLYKDTGRENEAQRMMERANKIQAKQ
ncbi:MAG: tetratricopeptide repeat protein [Thermodesulfobacteriota bacterium]|nr:tetratricopeptide repeat protein [Thermodesulfobacteriota bacterium]